MDFWSRLIGGLGTNQSKHSASNDPQQRLGRFRKIYNQCLQAWHKSTGGGASPDPAYIPVVHNHLQRLTDALRQDIRAPAPHLCVSFAASSKIYASVSNIACAFSDADIAREASSLFSTLIDSEEEDFLSSAPFADALSALVDKILGHDSLELDAPVEADLLELIFTIAANIKLEPSLLRAWFKSSPKINDDGDNAAVDPKEPTIIANYDFALCYHFIERVYREGRVGDFARTGLLYIFETASESSDLERWIVDSALPTLMASGLGALYSQLSRKLSINPPSDDLPLILALADTDTKQPASDVEDFFSPSLQTQLDTFMSYFIFWQDILEHCRSVSVKQTLIDHFQVFFLQQILYPSLLQSSDVDGGSSVAVLTYLWRILESVDHPDLIHMMLHYLLAMPEPLPPRSPIAEKRRKSLTALTASQDMNPTFFNLVDLCLASLRSYNNQTIIAALRLVSVILSKHHNYAVETLLRTMPINSSPALRNIGVLRQDVEALLDLSQNVGGEEGMDEAYESCLKDALGLLENHVCSASLLRVGEPSGSIRKFQQASRMTESLRTVQKHALNHNDPCLKSLLTILETFFTNNVETNLGVTDALSQLASCPYLRLDGWLATSSTMDQHTSEPLSKSVIDMQAEFNSLSNFDELDKLENERILAYNRTRLSTSPQPMSLVLKILSSLNAQLEDVRKIVPDLDNLVASRKRAFVGAAENDRTLSPAFQPLLSPRSSVDMSRDPSLSRSAPPENRNRDFFCSDSQLARSPSPRGRAMLTLTGKGMSSPSLSPSKAPRSPLFSLSPSRTERPVGMVSPSGSEMLPGSPKKFLDKSPIKPSRLSQVMSVDTKLFEQKLKFPLPGPDIFQGSEILAEDERDAETADEYGEASLNHVLTNAVILQEFIMELAAIMHVRASLFDGEVKFL